MSRHTLRRLTARSSRHQTVIAEPLEGRMFLTAAPASFLQPVTFGSAQATSVASGDFNGDGNEDLALAGAGGIVVLLGKGDGTFADPVQVAADGAARHLYAVDVTGDWNLDLAWVDAGDGAVHLLAGNGDGTFTGTATIVPAVAGASAVAFDDVTGDGNTDLIVAGTGGLVVVPANADGSAFGAAFLLHGGAFSGVTTSDVDWDGNDDVIAVGSGQVQVFSSKGDGTFAAPQTYAAGPGASAVVAGDFNDDGITDLAVATPGESGIAILLGKADADMGDALGTFAAATHLQLGAAANSLTLGDANGDYEDDLVAATANGVVVLASNGDGTFAGPATYDIGLNASDVALDDFNADGYLDLAAVSAQANGAAVMLQTVPDVSVTVNAPAAVAVNGTLTYTITVAATGATASTGVWLSDCLPTGATLVSATSSQGTVDTSAASDGSINVDLGTMAGGTSAVVTIIVRPHDFGVISNEATVSADSPDGDWSNNYADSETHVVGATGAELELSQDATGGGTILPIYNPIATPIVRPVNLGGGGSGNSDGVITVDRLPAGGTTGIGIAAGEGGFLIDPGFFVRPIPNHWWGGFINVGDDITYTLTLTNYGPDAAASAAITDTLPAGVTFVSATASQGTVDTSKPSIVTASLGDLASGASATLTIVAKAAQPGTLTNSASATSATADPYADDNSSSITRYVTDASAPSPDPTPLPGPIGWLRGGPVYAAGAGASAGNTLASDAIASSAAPCRINVKDVKIKAAADGKSRRAVFTVTRGGNRKVAATVHFATADASGKAGPDYAAAAGTLTFAPGVRKLKVTVPLKSPQQAGTSKAFNLNLSGATNAAITRSTATGTIKVRRARKSPAGGAGTIRINFQPAAAQTPTGFIADTGRQFGASASGAPAFGWDADASATAAYRVGPANQPETTYNVLQAGPHHWELALANGRYKVSLAASQKTLAEGTAIVTGKSTAAHPFATGSKTITVSDGRLTLTTLKANDQLAFIEVTPIAG